VDCPITYRCNASISAAVFPHQMIALLLRNPADMAARRDAWPWWNLLSGVT